MSSAESCACTAITVAPPSCIDRSLRWRRGSPPTSSSSLSMLHRGSLADGDLTYGELGAHVMRHEISVEGPLREHYLIGFLDTDHPGQWETEIGWPIFRSAS